MPPITRILFVLLLLLSPASFAQAQNVPQMASQCQLIADGLGKTMPVRFEPARSRAGPILFAQAQDQPVTITYIGHSTFFIETPGGITIATDYNGWFTTPSLPTVVTMNKAHSSHYTMNPDPGIEHVLHGWGDDAKPADHDLVVGDAYIRNVPTDIRSWGGAMEENGNSIFIFEVAGLCIGHLGHLHHELTDQQYGEIGRLDVLMVPVDGGLTMGAESMSRVVKRLRSALILPMHRPGPMVRQFVGMFGDDYDKVFADEASLDVSLRSLPRRPTIHILAGL
ncbi:MAG: MBL fold metallo-hydrolase [Shinella sp.]|nr:MBL fold metallo-hydrolase [Shinella sp.]